MIAYVVGDGENIVFAKETGIIYWEDHGDLQNMVRRVRCYMSVWKKISRANCPAIMSLLIIGKNLSPVLAWKESAVVRLLPAL